MKRVYLDYNATAPMLPSARQAMVEAFDLIGNASSIHQEGQLAASAIECVRLNLAHILGVSASTISFTSGATEAANMVLTPGFFSRGRKTPLTRFFYSPSEHLCVLEGHRFPSQRIEALKLDQQGLVDREDLERKLVANAEPAMVAVQLANNETGVVQPIADIADIVHTYGGVLICDGVQAFLRYPLSFSQANVDGMFISAHKFGGPKGVGALILAEEAKIIHPILRGGGQERGLRAGTQNVAAIAGMGGALRWCQQHYHMERERLKHLRDDFEKRLAQIEGVHIFASDAPRLANVSAFGLPDLEAHLLLIALDQAGVAVSSGSACSSGKIKSSHVLKSMGVRPELIRGALRMSLGWASCTNDRDYFYEVLEKIVKTMRARRTRLQKAIAV